MSGEWRWKPRSGALRVLLFSPCFPPALVVLLWLSWSESARRPEVAVSPDRVATVDGWIASSVQRREGYLYFELRPVRVERAGTGIDYPGDVAVYVRAGEKREPGLEYGDRVRFVAYLREPSHYAIPGVVDFREVLWRRGILHVVRLASLRQLERLGAEGGVRFLLFRYRAAFERRLDAELEAGPRELVSSAFLGERKALDEEEKARVRRLGVLHLFVVSGFHVSLVVLLAHYAGHRAGWAGKAAALGAGWSYVLLTGASTTAVRAGVMTSVYYVARSLGLTPRLLNSLGIATLLLAAIRPAWVDSPGYHFCFASLTVIGAWLEPSAAWFTATGRGLRDAFGGSVDLDVAPDGRWRRRVRSAAEDWLAFLPQPAARAIAGLAARPASVLPALAWCSLSIQVATLPLALYYSNLLSWPQVLNNLLLVPAFSLLILLSLIWFVSFWLPGLGVLASALTSLWAGLVWDLMHWLDAFSAPAFLPQPTVAEGAAYLLALALLWCCRRTGPRLLLACAPPLFLAWLSWSSSPSSATLAITFLDVGQGEAIHLSYPDGSHALVDCGGLRLSPEHSDFVGRALVGRYLWSLRRGGLDYVLLSHPHADHVQGLRFLRNAFHPRRIYFFEPDDAYAPHPGLQRLHRGRHFRWGGVHHEVLHPAAGSSWSTNNASLVLRLQYGRFSLLLTGDIEREAEYHLDARGLLAPATVLKVPHHGAATGSSKRFLDRVRPRLAVISAGRRNLFGHPSKAVLDRLTGRQIAVLLTARNGSIRIETDGIDWSAKTYDVSDNRFVLVSIAGRDARATLTLIDPSGTGGGSGAAPRPADTPPGSIEKRPSTPPAD